MLSREFLEYYRRCETMECAKCKYDQEECKYGMTNPKILSTALELMDQIEKAKENFSEYIKISEELSIDREKLRAENMDLKAENEKWKYLYEKSTTEIVNQHEEIQELKQALKVRMLGDETLAVALIENRKLMAENEKLNLLLHWG